MEPWVWRADGRAEMSPFNSLWFVLTLSILFSAALAIRYSNGEDVDWFSLIYLTMLWLLTDWTSDKTKGE